MEAHHPHIKNKVYWHVFPTYSEAKEAVWKDPNMLNRVIPKELIARQNEVELTLYLKSGCVICLKGADHPDSLRGAGPYGIIFDEFDTMKIEAWQTMEPVIRASGGWAWFIGTPRGKRYLYDFHNKKNPQWKSWLLKASESGIISKKELEESRKTAISEAFFNQEFECEFLEGEGAVFKGVREVCTAQPEKPLEGHHYIMGVDLAKHQDYTVIVVYDRATNRQVYQQRFNKLDWPYQKQKITETCLHYNKAAIILDATGIGDVVYDDLSAAGLPITPFKFTSPEKNRIVQKLAIWIEQQTITMINNTETLFEFDNFAYEIGLTGQIRYGAPQGYNDDIVIAHALAVESLNLLYTRKIKKKRTRIQSYYDKAKRNYNRPERAVW